jgi:RNA polymerase-interacting CarD/CdnL/TRCF family regulator
LELDVDDVVVYGSHGIGRVAARRKQVVLGEQQDVVVLELEGLTVTLPLALAETQLRQLADDAELDRVQEALRADSQFDSRNWLSRRRDAHEKLVGGTPVELAEMVNEGTHRGRRRSTSGGKGQLSPSERASFMKARALLTDEVARVLGIDSAAAERWIDSNLPQEV